MRYVKIATCAAILLSGAASANLAFAGSNKPSSPPGASIVTQRPMALPRSRPDTPSLSRRPVGLR